MATAVFLLLIVAPIVEIWAAVAVAGQLGGSTTVLLLLGLSLAGMWLIRREGAAAWRSVNSEVRAGRSPAPRMLDGALALIGSALLILPGFISAAAGLLLLLPPVRALLRPLLLLWATRRAGAAAAGVRMNGLIVTSGVDADGRIHRSTSGFGDLAGFDDAADVIDAEGWDVRAGDDAPPRQLPGTPGPHPDDVIDVDGHRGRAR